MLMALTAAASAGSLEFSTTNLAGARKGIDNIKGSAGTTCTVRGAPIKITAAYDMKAKSEFIKELSVAGTMDPMAYCVTQSFAAGTSKLALSTNKFGSTLKAVITSKLTALGRTTAELSAVKRASIAGGLELSIVPAYAVTKNVGRLTTTAAYSLGGGAVVEGELITTTSGDVAADVEVVYDTKLDGRTITATLKPFAQALVASVTDASVGVMTASYTLGGKPKFAVKRSVSF